MSKTYYKIITKDRHSAITSNKRVRVRYPLNEWAYPKLEGSKLMVFDNKRAAYDFMIVHSTDKCKLVVVKCNVQHPVKMPCVIQCVGRACVDNSNSDKAADKIINTKNLREFWQHWNKVKAVKVELFNTDRYLKWKKLSDQVLTYSGSYIMCSSVKCLE